MASVLAIIAIMTGIVMVRVVSISGMLLHLLPLIVLGGTVLS
jgi:hypothetical protein